MWKKCRQDGFIPTAGLLHVEVKYADGTVDKGPAESFRWSAATEYYPNAIVKWRLLPNGEQPIHLRIKEK